MFSSSAIIWTVNHRSDQTSSLTCAMLLVVVRCAAHLQRRFCLQKTFSASERLVRLHCMICKGLLKFSMCCGGTVTECNTHKKKMANMPLRDVPCFHFHDKVQKHLLIRQAPAPHWGIAKPCHCKWGWRKDQGQSLSLLAGCSTASTASRKFISLLYSRTSYMRIISLHVFYVVLCVVMFSF